MATSAVEIANSALTKIGAERISALEDNNVRAIACNEQYHKARRFVLRGHPWQFALRRAVLAEDVLPPEWEWSNRFLLPADCLRVVKTNLGEDVPWVVEGRYLLCNSSEVSIQYIFNCTDETLFDANFEEVFALRLAADVCYRVTQSLTLQSVMYDAFKKELAEARSYSSQETSGIQLNADWSIQERY